MLPLASTEATRLMALRIDHTPLPEARVALAGASS
jgi:hypothetical protein